MASDSCGSSNECNTGLIGVVAAGTWWVGALITFAAVGW